VQRTQGPIVRLRVSGSLHPAGGGFLTLAGTVQGVAPELEPRIRKTVAWFELKLQEKIDAATREQANSSLPKDC